MGRFDAAGIQLSCRSQVLVADQSFARDLFSTFSTLFLSLTMKTKTSSSHAAVRRKPKTRSAHPRKKVKIASSNLEDLPWKSLARPMETGLDGDDGILELEEVEGVEIVYEDTGKGRVAKFKVRTLTVLQNCGLIFVAGARGGAR